MTRRRSEEAADTPRWDEVPELVEQIAKIVEARGGRWPQGIHPTIVGLVSDVVARQKRSPRACVLAFLRAHGGVYNGTQEEIASALGLPRETVTRALGALTSGRARCVRRMQRYELVD